MKIWLCDLTHTQQTVAADAMPASVAYIASYVLADPEIKREVRLFKYPEALAEAVNKDPLPDVIGFSHFMWNARLSIRMAEWIKSRKPEIAVVFGGLNFPNEEPRQKAWLERYPHVDFHVYKEGEIPFRGLVESLEKHNLDLAKVKALDLPGVHHLYPDGSFQSAPEAARIDDFNMVPSPYQTHLLDEFFDGRLMPIISTNRGCPYKCTFCAEGQDYYNRVNKLPSDRVVQDIEYIANKCASMDYPRKDLYITDSNFGLNRENISLAHSIKEIRDHYGWPHHILATTAKNSKTRTLEIADILQGSIKISGSVQTMDKQVSKAIKRDNIREEELMEVAATASGADTYSDVILGLPGDSYEAHKGTIETLVNAKFDRLTLYQLRLQADAEMNTAAYREKFQIKGKWRILNRCFGNYSLGNGEILSVTETEEVCISGVNLPYEDYLRARTLDLIVSIFYFDRFLEGFMLILDLLEIERFQFVEQLLNTYQTKPEFAQLVEDYLGETQSELFDTEEEALNASEQPGAVEKYLSSELGANLIGKYRLLSITTNLGNVFDLAKTAVINILNEENVTEKNQLIRFIEELSRFEIERRRDLFEESLGESVKTFDFNVLEFFNISSYDEFKSKVLDSQYPRDIRFNRDSDQEKRLAANNRIFGTGIMGRYKQLTRTKVKSMYRHASFADSLQPSLTPTLPK